MEKSSKFAHWKFHNLRDERKFRLYQHHPRWRLKISLIFAPRHENSTWKFHSFVSCRPPTPHNETWSHCRKIFSTLFYLWRQMFEESDVGHDVWRLKIKLQLEIVWLHCRVMPTMMMIINPTRWGRRARHWRPEITTDPRHMISYLFSTRYWGKYPRLWLILISLLLAQLVQMSNRRKIRSSEFSNFLSIV